MDKKKIFGNPCYLITSLNREIGLHELRMKEVGFAYTPTFFKSLQSIALLIEMQAASLGFDCGFTCNQFVTPEGNRWRIFNFIVGSPDGYMNRTKNWFKIDLSVRSYEIEDSAIEFFNSLYDLRHYVEKRINENGLLDLEF